MPDGYAWWRAAAETPSSLPECWRLQLARPCACGWSEGATPCVSSRYDVRYTVSLKKNWVYHSFVPLCKRSQLWSGLGLLSALHLLSLTSTSPTTIRTRTRVLGTRYGTRYRGTQVPYYMTCKRTVCVSACQFVFQHLSLSSLFHHREGCA